MSLSAAQPPKLHVIAWSGRSSAVLGMDPVGVRDLVEAQEAFREGLLGDERVNYRDGDRLSPRKLAQGRGRPRARRSGRTSPPEAWDYRAVLVRQFKLIAGQPRVSAETAVRAPGGSVAEARRLLLEDLAGRREAGDFALVAGGPGEFTWHRLAPGLPVLAGPPAELLGKPDDARALVAAVLCVAYVVEQDRIRRPSRKFLHGLSDEL